MLLSIFSRLNRIWGSSCPVRPVYSPLPGLWLLTLLAAIYLKNRVTRGWSPIEEVHQATPISDSEKESFRNRAISILANSPSQVRAQFQVCLQKVLSYDFPEKWPHFIDVTLQLLQAGDANTLFAGIQCIAQICRVYRFRAIDSGRQDFDKVVSVSFPQLLNIGNGLVNETSIEAGEMLRAILKSYKHAIYVSSLSRSFDAILTRVARTPRTTTTT